MVCLMVHDGSAVESPRFGTSSALRTYNPPLDKWLLLKGQGKSPTLPEAAPVNAGVTRLGNPLKDEFGCAWTYLDLQQARLVHLNVLRNRFVHCFHVEFRMLEASLRLAKGFLEMLPTGVERSLRPAFVHACMAGDTPPVVGAPAMLHRTRDLATVFGSCLWWIVGLPASIRVRFRLWQPSPLLQCNHCLEFTFSQAFGDIMFSSGHLSGGCRVVNNDSVLNLLH